MIRQMDGAARLALTAMATGALLATSGAATASTPTHGAPVYRQAPAHAPGTTERNHACTVTGGGVTPGANNTAQGLIWADAHPTGMVSVWLPGLNAKRCVARRVVSGATLATRVATAIDTSPAVPNGALPCPYSDGVGVRLYLTYSGGRDEYAGVSLNGCREAMAPNRAARWAQDRLNNQLAKAAPPAWQSYFTSGSSAHLATASHGTPVTEPAPATAPAASESNGSRQAPDPAAGQGIAGGKNLVWLRSHPTGLVMIWRPGLNAKHCVARRVVEGSQVARRIVAAVQTAPAEPRGLFCPRDDGSSVDIYPTYGASPDEFAHVELTGCATVSAPQRGARESSTRLRDALRTTAPRAWRSYFAN